MRHTISFIVIFMLGICGITELGAQAYPDRHSNVSDDAWLSGTATQSPNAIRGVVHWIRYDLGRPILCINPNFGTSIRRA